MQLSEREEYLASRIVKSAIEIHKELGPGLLEKIYEICLCNELRDSGIEVVRQCIVPVHYKGVVFEEGLRLDLLVDDLVVIEVKSVEIVNPVWQAQVLSQLKLTGKRLGFLLNFNVPLMKEGIKRFIL